MKSIVYIAIFIISSHSYKLFGETKCHPTKILNQLVGSHNVKSKFVKIHASAPEVTDTYLDSIVIKLLENESVKIADQIEEQRATIYEALTNINNKKRMESQDEFFETLTDYLIKRYPEAGEDIQKAAADSANYLNNGPKQFAQSLDIKTLKFNKKAVKVTEADLNNEELNDLAIKAKWPDVDSYVENRVGPLNKFIQDLKPNDEIVSTNLDLETYLSSVNLKASDIEHISELNLPISSYKKSIHIITDKNGKRTMLIGEYETPDYLHHYEMMIRRAAHNSGIKFRRLEDMLKYEGPREKLKNFFTDNNKDLKGVSNIAIGYDYAFKNQLKGKIVKEITDTKNEWDGVVYQLEGGEKLLVLSTEQATYGKFLAEQVDLALEQEKGIRKVFFGGSGGAFENALPYELVKPNKLHIAGTSNYQDNILSAPSESVSIHISVASPLEETPEMIKKSLAKNVQTVDMEVSHLANVVSKHNRELGVAIITTDSPSNFVSFKEAKINLTKQRFDQKIVPRNEFVEKVLNNIEGRKSYTHPIEKTLGEYIPDISNQNMARLKTLLGKLSPKEAKLVEKILKTKMEFYLRMSPGRLWYMLQDKTLLSTQKVKEIYKTATTEYTPAIEDKLFDAYDYIFSSFGLWKGKKDYGEIIVKLDPDKVMSESWGSLHSGHHYLESAKSGNKNIDEVTLLNKAQKKMQNEIFSGDDYKEALALKFIEKIRDESVDFDKILEMPVEEFSEWLKSHKHFFMEAHHQGYINLDQVNSIEIPSEGIGENLIDLLKENDISFTKY